MKKPQIAAALVVVLLALGLSPSQVLPPTDLPTSAAESPKLLPEPRLRTAGVTVGKASWYGPRFHGRPTASGAAFNRYALTAASRNLRLGTLVRVTNLRNQHSAVLLINDWGPVPEDRIIDVSEAAAAVLGFHHQGLAPVQIEVYSAALSP